LLTSTCSIQVIKSEFKTACLKNADFMTQLKRNFLRRKMNKYLFIPALLLTFCVSGIFSANAQTEIKNGGTKTPVNQTSAIEETVKLETLSGNLYGTLLLPKSKSKLSIVLIIAGSGPTDRDGNSPLLKGANNSLKLLAEGLAANGIASLRYDKRGVGESGKEMLLAAQKANKMPREEDLVFDAYIDDAVMWGQKLRADKRFSTLTIAGHSEGSLIGMVAAQKMKADAFISIAGAGRPVGQILLEQLKAQMPPDLMKTSEDILRELSNGKTVETVPSALNIVFRRSVQPYMISWLRYDPAKEIAKLTVPVMITQGTTDIQATAQDVKLLAAAKPSATVLMIDGMNHVLKVVPSDRDKQLASYSDPALPVVPKLIDEISRFVNKAKQ
ncbi:MAG TPA: alpha/beta hydrolase, partial [Pyrinomonadaceae bacterium]